MVGNSVFSDSLLCMCPNDKSLTGFGTENFVAASATMMFRMLGALIGKRFENQLTQLIVRVSEDDKKSRG